jgi:enoyl-CoA hydratase
MNSDGVVRWAPIANGIARIDLARAPANALGLPIIDGLDEALNEATAGGARIIIIASAIEGFFAAGADIKLMSTIPLNGFTMYGDALRAVLARLASPQLITIAAVEGLALGGGLELAMACTLRVAGADARFGLPEVKLGLIPGAGGTQRLPRLVGRGRALDIMLTARQVPAEEAAAIGLVDRLVAAGGALDAALELAAELRIASAKAQAAVIRAVDAAGDLPLAEGIAVERDEVGRQFDDGDGREGLTAFLEKRPADFG